MVDNPRNRFRYFDSIKQIKQKRADEMKNRTEFRGGYLKKNLVQAKAWKLFNDKRAQIVGENWKEQSQLVNERKT